MELVVIRDKNYIVKFSKIPFEVDTDKDVSSCLVELTFDEIQIIHDYPSETFKYIYEDKNGRQLYLIKIEIEIDDNASIEEAIDQLCSFDKYRVSRQLISSLKDLVDWRYANKLTYGTRGCVICHNKVKFERQVFLEPYEYDSWLKANSYSIMKEIQEWALDNLKVFKEDKLISENVIEEIIKADNAIVNKSKEEITANNSSNLSADSN